MFFWIPLDSATNMSFVPSTVFLVVMGVAGCGKSSLFAAVRGEIEPDKGDIDRPNKLRMASVAQETPALPDPAGPCP